MSEGITIRVAPTFATNLRAKLIAAMQPRRMMSFLLALGVLIYYSVRGVGEQMRHACLALAIVLPTARVLVVALSSFVTKSSRDYLTMIMTFNEDTIDVTRWGVPKREDWTFIRKAIRQQGTLALELQNSYDYVLVDRAKISEDDWNRLEALLARRGKL